MEFEIVSKFGPIVLAYLGVGIVILTTVILFGAALYSQGDSIVGARVVWPSLLAWFVFATAWPAVLAMGVLACLTVALAQVLARALDDERPRVSRENRIAPVEDNAPTQPFTTPTAFVPSSDMHRSDTRRSSPALDPEEPGNDPFN